MKNRPCLASAHGRPPLPDLPWYAASLGEASLPPLARGRRVRRPQLPIRPVPTRRGIGPVLVVGSAISGRLAGADSIREAIS